MGCLLLVSLTSLICLILLPLIFSGEHTHSHDHHDGQAEHHGHFGSHSFQDLSIGLSILAGIVIFPIVERLVRYVDDFSGGVNAWSLGHHHHHHHKHINNLKDDDEDAHENPWGSAEEKNERSLKNKFEENERDGLSAGTACGNKPSEKDVLWKRNTGRSSPDNLTDLCADCISIGNAESINREPPTKSQLNLVFGYLNLFSDGVIGDFGILVRSGFSISKGLFFNFLSALVTLAGTALVGRLFPLTVVVDGNICSLIIAAACTGFNVGKRSRAIFLN